MKAFEDNFQYKLIYIFSVHDDAHKGLLKIGDATVKSSANVENLFPNCKILNQAARARIKQFTNTVGVNFDLLHTELAIYKVDGNLEMFRDYDVHKVLTNSNFKRKSPQGSTGQEWFEVSLETARLAIKAVKKICTIFQEKNLMKKILRR